MLYIYSTAAAAGEHNGIDVALLGDSNTWIGGERCDSPKGWPKWFIEKFEPATCTNYSRSGATWTNTSFTVRDLNAYSEVIDDNNVIYNQIERLIAAAERGTQQSPELIIIGAGTNDAWFVKRRPEVFSASVADVFADEKLITSLAPSEARSLAAAVRYGCELLMARFPGAQIILLTPPQATVCSYENIRKVADIIRESGKRLSIGVVSLDQEGGIYRSMEKNAATNTSDGVHTSEKGARKLGCYIANKVYSILQF